MSKTLIALIFLLAGICYGSLAFDDIYKHTFGYLIEHNWIKAPPTPDKDSVPALLGRKPTILFYAFILIIIGLFLLWNRNT
ncbi:MAG: hypothetical protein P4L74_00670 [Candidatus Doudnabacteria bacterium]|nr:hypothetical protein [Candidatus Doudnabacteria bacterium]